jgi:hypothetical protein
VVEALHTLLHLRIASGKVIKCLGARFGSEDGERQVVVLEVETNAREVNNGLHSSTTELCGVACTNNQPLDGLPISEKLSSLPTPDRCKIRGEDMVPPETTICLRALKMRAPRFCARSV